MNAYVEALECFSVHYLGLECPSTISFYVKYLKKSLEVINNFKPHIKFRLLQIKIVKINLNV